QDENLVQSIQKLEVIYSEDDLKQFLKSGAQVNSHYVLNYTNEISSHIKQLFRNKTNAFWNEVEEKLNENINEIKAETISNNKLKKDFEVYETKKEKLEKELDLTITNFNETIANNLPDKEINELVNQKVLERSEIKKESLPEIEKKSEVDKPEEELVIEEDVLPKNNITTPAIIHAID